MEVCYHYKRLCSINICLYLTYLAYLGSIWKCVTVTKVLIIGLVKQIAQKEMKIIL